MVIHSVLVAKHLQKQNKYNTCPPMYNSKVQPKGCKKEELVKKPVNTTKCTETENFYASLITTAVNSYKDSKQKPN